MTFRYDENGTPGELRPLWEEAFGADENSLSWFLRAALSADGLPCLRCDGEVVSAFLRFNVTFGPLSGVYIYGLCTKKEWRGRGCMRTLLDEAAKAVKEEGRAFLTLIPANQELAETYSRIGFVPRGLLGTRKNDRGNDIPALSLHPGYTAEPDPAALSEMCPQNGLSDEAFRLALDSIDGLVPVRIRREGDASGETVAVALRGENGRYFVSTALSPVLAHLPPCLREEEDGVDNPMIMPLTTEAADYYGRTRETAYSVEPLPR